jgi:cell division protein FtsL
LITKNKEKWGGDVKNTGGKSKNSKRVNRTNAHLYSVNRRTMGTGYASTNSGSYMSATEFTRNIYSKYGGDDGSYSAVNSAGRNDVYSYNRSVNTARRTAENTRRNGYASGVGSPMYNPGSEAYETAYDNEWVPQKKESNTRAVKKKSVVQRVREVAPLSLVKTIFTVVVCTFYVLSIVICIASNNNYKTELVEAKNTLTQLESDNAELKNEIDDNIDLAKVEREAKKLGMDKPSAFQIVKINVPKESYTVQYGADEVSEDSVGFAEVVESITDSIQKKLDKILRID